MGICHSLCTVVLCFRLCSVLSEWGALNEETIICDCSDGFSGSNCESECILHEELPTSLAPANLCAGQL